MLIFQVVEIYPLPMPDSLGIRIQHVIHLSLARNARLPRKKSTAKWSHSLVRRYIRSRTADQAHLQYLAFSSVDEATCVDLLNRHRSLYMLANLETCLAHTYTNTHTHTHTALKAIISKATYPSPKQLHLTNNLLSKGTTGRVRKNVSVTHTHIHHLFCRQKN